MQHRRIGVVRRQYLGSHFSATPKACLISIRYSVILMAAPPGMTQFLSPLHTQSHFPSLSTRASTGMKSTCIFTQPRKCHIRQLCQPQDDSKHPRTCIQNTGLHPFLTLATMFPQPQHCQKISIILPSSRGNLGSAYSFSLPCPKQFQPPSPGL